MPTPASLAARGRRSLGNSFSAPAVDLLRARFPGRFTVTKGDSLKEVPRYTLPPGTRCDLVHVDGKHSYQHTLLDFLNLVPKARAHALFIFDDQCDPRNCRGWTVVPGEPTLATCDLVSTGLLERIVSFYEGPRQFALFRLNQTAAAHAHNGHRAAAPGAAGAPEPRQLAGRRLRQRPAANTASLPCGPLCTLNWTAPWHNTMWSAHLAKKMEKMQRHFRPRNSTMAGGCPWGV